MTKRIHEQQRSLKSNQNYIETAGSNMRLYGRENNICACISESKCKGK